MKIRNGFVSNSSSSSFIIWFPFNFEKLEEVFNQEYYPHDIERLKKETESRIKCLDEEYKSYEIDEENTVPFMLRMTEEGYKYTREKYKRILELIDESPLESFLVENGITYDIYEHITILNKHVMMFNHYLDMGNFLINLTMACKAEGLDFELKVEED